MLKQRYILRTILIVLGVILALTGAFVGEQYYRWHICNFVSRDGEPHEYNIYAGSTTDSVLNLLREDYEISSETDLKLHIRYFVLNYPEEGHYRFPAQIGDRELIERLKYGHQTPVRITWNHFVRTREDLAGKVTRHLLMDSVTLLHLLEDDAFLEPYGLNKETSRCLFIPNTYEVYWNITPKKLLQKMAEERKAFWNGTRAGKAKELGMTPDEVVTLASIIDEETANDAEKPMIAGMYYNRLKQNMPLQADPTVKYALGDFSLKRIYNNMLRTKSPYNTYVNIGLPPGPIRIPTVAGIDAVLNMVHHDYLYMCAKADFSGTHTFARTYQEHLTNAAEYTKALNARAIK
jgi:UPF0755 protein